MRRSVVLFGPGRRSSACTLLVMAFFVLVAVRSVLAEAARLEVVAHPEFARVVVQSSSPAVGLRVTGGTAELRLDPAQPITVPPLPTAARAWLLAAEAREGGARLAFALAPDVTARLVEPGPGRVVVDLVRDRGPTASIRTEPGPQASAGAPSAGGGPTRAMVRVRTGKHEGFRRLVVEGPGVDRLGLRLEGERIEIAGPPAVLPSIGEALDRLTPAVARVETEESRLRVELAPGVRVLKRAADRDRIVLDLVGPTGELSAPVEKRREETSAPASRSPAEVAKIDPGNADAATSGSRFSPDCRAIDPRRGLCVRLRTALDSAEVTLLVEPRPGAAVLASDGALWVVLDRAVARIAVEGLPVDAAPAGEGDALVRSIRAQPHPEATLLRFDTNVPVSVEAEPMAKGWRLHLRPGQAPSAAGEGRILRLVDPPALAIETAAPRIVLPAALLGSEVSVLPTTEKTGRIGPRRFVDLEILPTAQGVAWRALAEDLRARRVGRRWLIDRPGGLRPEPSGASAAGPAPPMPRLSAEGPANGPVATANAASAPVTPASASPAASEGGAAPASAGAAPVASPAAAASGHGRDRQPIGPGGGDRTEGGGGSGAKPTSPAPTEVTLHGGEGPAVPGTVSGGANGERRSGVPPTRGESAIGLARLASTGEPGGSALAAGLLDRRAAADAETRAAVDRRLAREALARGRAAEALALLGDPPAASDTAAEPPGDPATRALAGVAAVLLDRLAAGERLLDDPRLAADAEVALWRAVAAARAFDWPRAASAYAAAGRTFQNYPPLLQRRLAPLVARILVESGKPAAALAVLDLARRHDPDPREAARLSLVEGLALERQGSPDAAAAAFRSAAEAGDPPTAIEARYRSARLEQARGRSDPEKASLELGRQRLLWRDHPAEPEMLAGLVEVLAAAGRPAEALAVGRDLRTRHPMAPFARTVTDRMRDWLVAAVEATGDGPAGAVAGLRLVRTHSDLVPEGEAGVALARTLARRLAASGLPGAAASVLSEYGLPRLQGPARAELVLEVAELLLRAGDPGTVSALLDAEVGTFAAAAAMRARVEALRRAAEQRHAAEAVSADAGSRARDRLEAAWRGRDWRTVVETGTALLAGAREDEVEKRRLLLRVAVALGAEGRADAARELLERQAPLLRDLPATDPESRLLGLLSSRSGLAGDALQVAAALDGELAALRSGLARRP